MAENNIANDYVSINISRNFLDLYPYAKEAILFFEVHEGRMSNEAIIELRDALDHLMLAFNNHNDTDRIKAETNCALEHLRRASIEPFEWAVENIVSDLFDRYKYRKWYKYILVAMPDRKTYRPLIQDIKKELLESRNCKNISKWKDGVEHIKRAYLIALELENLFPEKNIILGRIFSIILFLLGVLVGFIIPIIF